MDEEQQIGENLMPLYSYQCTKPKCPGGIEAMRTVEARYIAPDCQLCGSPMKLEVQPVYGVVRDPAVPKSWKR